MESMFKKIGVAIAFSPRGEALLTEANRIRILFDAELVLIHVGQKSADAETRMLGLVQRVGIESATVLVRWEKGKPSERILSVCKQERIDLIVAGALKQENMLQYYLGSVARRILRKANCSVLMLSNPSTSPKPFKSIVVNAEDSPYVEQALRASCFISMLEKANWLHVVRELKLYGLTMAVAEQTSEEEYDDHRQNLVSSEIEIVENLLKKIPHEGVKVNIKILSGKSGYELAKFAEKKKADLLIVGAPARRFSLFDRMFPHDLEYVFADLPSNLLIIRPQKKQNG
jgi:nucleotide-binding universal stress UspA family protein